jgi:peptide/nickel transport system ATP-binding protein/oligopeptide transport system ATP-binding protein
MADDVAVMYAGQIVESAPVDRLFADPQHPYTIGLLGSVPRIEETRARLATIEGSVPNPAAFPPGCRFAPRCPFAADKCRAEAPPLRPMGEGHRAACWRAPVEMLVAA